MIEVRKREGESNSAFLIRFSKKIKQSGVLLEAKKRRYFSRKPNKNNRKASAIYRAQKSAEFKAARKNEFRKK